ncbi:phospholipase A and acyltransferase 4-like, partial [Xenentodon cancila]
LVSDFVFLPVSSTSVASIEKFFDTDKKEAKPGDLIEIFRGVYKHWAVYVGGGYVVHLVTTGEYYGHIVLKQKLEDVVGKDKWKVNNLLDHKHKPRPVNDIVKSACSMVDTNLEYDLLKYNCEHFATEMRYGKPESRQVQNAAAAGLAVGLGSLGASAMS